MSLMKCKNIIQTNTSVTDYLGTPITSEFINKAYPMLNDFKTNFN